MTTDTTFDNEAPQRGAGAATEHDLVSHARALADELRGGPVAAALLAMANECERVQHKYEALQADREMWREFGGDALTTAEMLRDALDSARRSARAWKRVAKAQREALGESIAAATLAHEAWGRERGANAALQAEIEREATAADRWHTTACEMRDVARQAIKAWRTWRARAGRWKRAAKAQREALGEAQAAATLAHEAWGRERQRRRIAEAAWRGPYRVGVVDEASGLHYAGATFTHEVYDASGDPCEPIASCDTPDQAARLVALLNRYEATARETWRAREGERE